MLAGKLERKRYGIELHRAGFAKWLLLSVGRFEVSKMPTLLLPFVAELMAKRDQTAPEQRHFFCHMDERGTRISTTNLQRWNTYGEALGLREYLEEETAERVIVVSTDIHLRRVALTFQKVFCDSTVKFQYCPVPASQSSLSTHRWWTRQEDRRYVVSETVKLIGYRLILLMPEFMIRRCMTLRG